MPVLSRFCGIVVRMLFAPLLGAHFHAIYGDRELMVAIEPLAIIQGDVPDEVRRLVLAWARTHQRELLTAWRRCGAGLRPQTIAPLTAASR
jgi:hypothetical protein